MYAVIKTGGKQYRVQPGDLMVVEKLAGEPGATVDFGEVLMLGEGEAITVGAPTVAGAKVAATLIETRKGEKVKIFKKIRRQGYRRTRGHRQWESVLRVTAITGDGREAKWDGEVNLTPKAVLDARARNLKIEGLTVEAAAPAPAAQAAPKKPRAKAAPVADAEAVAASPQVQEAMASAEVNAPVETPAKPAKAKKASASEDVAASPEVQEAMASAEVNAPVEAKPKKAAAPKAAKAEGEAEPKKAAPKKAAPKKDKDAE
jgi:large subunit ribosomal protein L21